jgi:hypothetical protein
MEKLNIFTLVFNLTGGLLCFFALRLLWQYKVYGPLLISIICQIIFAGGVLAILLGLDLMRYENLAEGKSVAVAHFKQVSENQFQVKIKDNRGREYVQELTGSHWQISARVIKLDKRLAPGMRPMVDLDQFFTLASLSVNPLATHRSNQVINESKYIDFWRLLREVAWLNKLVSFQVITSLKHPIEDMSAYTINLTDFGLTAEKTQAGAPG